MLKTVQLDTYIKTIVPFLHATNNHRYGNMKVILHPKYTVSGIPRFDFVTTTHGRIKTQSKVSSCVLRGYNAVVLEETVSKGTLFRTPRG